jgi:hypothetical protein
MQDELDIESDKYAWSKVKYLYACAYELETVLNDELGIDPDRIETILSTLEYRLRNLREWQLLKQESENKRNATT